MRLSLVGPKTSSGKGNPMTRNAVAFILAVSLMTHFAIAQELKKDKSALYPAAIADRVRQNVANDAWAAGVRDRVVEAAKYWRDLSDDDLWELVFGPTLERSWMVWSNGYSPVTGKPVPMYNWVADAQHHPWKLQDPTSGECFPKNDFKAFYDSGLDTCGIFDPAKANRALLFNTEHPEASDPLHKFGVDDGTGYVNEKGEKWRFVAAYLIYGQWKQLIVSGVRICGAAHMLTGDPVYARKAGILLDRVADLYPDFDFKAQGILYEGPAVAGYVSTWHDTCEETRELIMGYDMVFEALRNDAELVAFLSRKAAEVGLENKKTTFADIQSNIEGRILRDALAHPEKIHSNYPRAEICKAVTTAILGEPEQAFWDIVDPMIERSTAVDGVTGEKGLAGYSSFTISALGCFLSEFSKSDPAFLGKVIDRHPNLRQTFRFFIDTMCLQRYYPLSGDTGHYGAALDEYIGINFLLPGDNLLGWGNWTLLSPSNYRFFWELYKVTDDTAYVQILYRANNYSVSNLPYDLYGGAPLDFQNAVSKVIKRDGTALRLPSVNKEGWHLAILRSGQGRNERALWLDYDSGGGHGHKDGMNIGLFAHGLDFMPEFGYPPVQFGGWTSPRAKWYTMTAAHNTVVIDGVNQEAGAGETTLWLDAQRVHAIRATGQKFANVERYERTVVLVDIDDEHFYVVDVFRVRGGHDHTKFQQSHYGEMTTMGLNLVPAGDYGHDTQMRSFKLDSSAKPGWRADWKCDDRQRLLSEPATLGMTYWDLTNGASAGAAEAWIVGAMFESMDELWIPRLIVRKQNQVDTPLESTFVSVSEPWKDKAMVTGVTRTGVRISDGSEGGDSEVALTITLANGLQDTLLIRDVERVDASKDVRAEKSAWSTDAQLALVRNDSKQQPVYIVGTKAGHFSLEDLGQPVVGSIITDTTFGLLVLKSDPMKDHIEFIAQ
jgi:hypothetical protein